MGTSRDGLDSQAQAARHVMEAAWGVAECAEAVKWECSPLLSEADVRSSGHRRKCNLLGPRVMQD